MAVIRNGPPPQTSGNQTAPAVMPAKEKLLRQHRHLFLATLLISASLLLPDSSAAQSDRRFTLGLMGGFGGALGSDPSSSTIDKTFLLQEEFDLGFQLVLNTEMRRGTYFGVRVGQLDVELANVNFLGLTVGPIESELTYVTAVGEYRLPAGIYDSGLFIGLGYYAVDGQGIFDDDTGLGLNIGTTGDFRINDRFSFLLEFSAHYADLDYAQFFVMGHAGIGFHF